MQPQNHTNQQYYNGIRYPRFVPTGLPHKLCLQHIAAKNNYHRKSMSWMALLNWMIWNWAQRCWVQKTMAQPNCGLRKRQHHRTPPVMPTPAIGRNNWPGYALATTNWPYKLYPPPEPERHHHKQLHYSIPANRNNQRQMHCRIISPRLMRRAQ